MGVGKMEVRWRWLMCFMGFRVMIGGGGLCWEGGRVWGKGYGRG